MAGHQSREANLARLKVLASDPAPENIRNLIDLIENLWIGDGFRRETDSDGILISLDIRKLKDKSSEDFDQLNKENRDLLETIRNSELWKKYWTIVKDKKFVYELLLPKEAME